MKILVTGRYGFVGKHLIKLLLKDPDNVVICIDDLSGSGDLIVEEYISVKFRFIQVSTSWIKRLLVI
ncbi:NAD-dependent epimerase/dehydratase family protein [[Flexibacter] sp. ATCC 35208]|uniref:NAD-dependent epimerase/dehydratase family protein n=1 Tax=[Flexibacter] sp. ATCC 35208 TaxID=1936242 RepID=UPI00117E94BF